jgi:hypothetical protein
MLTWNQLEAGSSKREAWLTGSEFVLSLKLISALADGRMLVFQHPVKLRHAHEPIHSPGNTSAAYHGKF